MFIDHQTEIENFHLRIKYNREIGRPAMIFVLFGHDLICENEQIAMALLDNLYEWFNLSAEQYCQVMSRIKDYFRPKLVALP